jgi:hypothetical protein
MEVSSGILRGMSGKVPDEVGSLPAERARGILNRVSDDDAQDFRDFCSGQDTAHPVRLLCGALLDFVMFVREFFCLIQFSESFVDVFHSGNPVSTPLSAGVFEVVAGSFQSTTGGVDFGRYILLRGA